MVPLILDWNRLDAEFRKESRTMDIITSPGTTNWMYGTPSMVLRRDPRATPNTRK